MRRRKSFFEISLRACSAAVLLAALFSTTQAQARDPEATPVEPIKFSEVEGTDECELKLQTRRFFTELSNRPEHQGYIINYASIAEPNSRLQLKKREQAITSMIAFRNYDRSRITLIRGGYRSSQATEFWMAPPNSRNPKPSSTFSDFVEPEPAPSTKPSTYVFATGSLEYYNGERILREFILEQVKRAEPTEPNDYDDEEPVDREGQPVRFRWAEAGIARLVAGQKRSRGVIIFYADDRRYDITKLGRFIEQGRDLLAKHGPLAKSRLTIEFGGYRETPTAEFWFVPANGESPKADPEQRCKILDIES
jgi:hypothetical protein